jgi:HEAT repeat protein
MSLGQYGVRALPALAGVLGSPDPDARWWAARGLAEAGGEGSAGLLVTALADADADVRACAALALGRLGAAPAAPALAARLADESTFVAGIAADALGMIGEAAVPALAEMLGHGRPHVRLLAVRALARTRSQRAAAPLFGVLEDSSYLVRYYALEAIDALGAGMVYFSP